MSYHLIDLDNGSIDEVKLPWLTTQGSACVGKVVTIETEEQLVKHVEAYILGRHKLIKLDCRCDDVHLIEETGECNVTSIDYRRQE